MNPYLLVGVGGSLGAASRYAISERMESPHGTTVVNLIGSFSLGLLIRQMTKRIWITEKTALIIGAGFLGAFTTLSTYSIDIVNLFEEGKHREAVLYFIANAIGGPLLAYLGWKISD